MEENIKVKTKKTRKVSFVFFLLLLLVLLTIGMYLLVKDYIIKKGQVNELKLKVETLNDEIQKCNGFIVQESGNFSEYEYCLKLLDKFAPENLQ